MYSFCAVTRASFQGNTDANNINAVLDDPCFIFDIHLSAKLSLQIYNLLFQGYLGIVS